PESSTIKLIVSSDEGSHWVEIIDQGMGMTKCDINVALERFGRVALPAEIARESTGLGLSIVQEITDQHEGLFDISSEPHVGTTARLSFAKMETAKLIS
ncbi:MAG: ATP-binding protein, partial [Pseudomonadota bacterium]